MNNLHNLTKVTFTYADGAETFIRGEQLKEWIERFVIYFRDKIKEI